MGIFVSQQFIERTAVPLLTYCPAAPRSAAFLLGRFDVEPGGVAGWPEERWLRRQSKNQLV
jgi:hypothetical protein